MNTATTPATTVAPQASQKAVPNAESAGTEVPASTLPASTVAATWDPIDDPTDLIRAFTPVASLVFALGTAPMIRFGIAAIPRPMPTKVTTPKAVTVNRDPCSSASAANPTAAVAAPIISGIAAGTPRTTSLPVITAAMSMAIDPGIISSPVPVASSPNP